MNFKESIKEGHILNITPNPSRAKNLRKQSIQTIETAKIIPLTQNSTSSIVRELYEGVRQYAESLGYDKGYKFQSHKSIMYFISDILHNDKLSKEFDRWRKLRNGIHFYGDLIEVETAKSALKKVDEFITFFKK